MAYTKRLKKKIFSIGVFLLVIFLSFAYCDVSHAEIGTGGVNPKVEGCEGTSVLRQNTSNNVVYTDYESKSTTFNCCHVNHEQCTRWIKVTNSEFKTAYDRSLQHNNYKGTYSATKVNQCANGKNGVIMAGLINGTKLSGGVNKYYLVLYNHLTTNMKKRNGYSFDWSSKSFSNFWGQSSGYKVNNKAVSWSDLLDLLKRDNNISSDTDVAFFCPENVPQTCTEHGGDKNGDGSCDCNDDNTCPTPTPPSLCSSHLPGSGYPGDKYSGRTSTYSSITSNIFTGENSLIYAKPGDTVSWNHCYYPGAQPVLKSSGSHEEPTSNRPSGGDDTPTVHVTESNTIGEQDTLVASSNSFTISTNNTGYLGSTPKLTLTSSAFSPSVATGSSVSFSGTRGQSTWTGADSNSMKILPQGAGSTVTQSINTQVGTNSVSGHHTWSWSWTYPYIAHHSGSNCSHCGETCTTTTSEDGKTSTSCSCNSCEWTTNETGHGYGTGYHYNSSSNNNWYTISSTTSSGGTNAKVNIPYNYTNYGDVQFGSDIIYAGEQFTTAEATAIVDVIDNPTTKGTYATKTPQVTAKLYIFYAPNYKGGGEVQASSSSHGDCGYYSGAGYSGCVVANTEYSTLNNGYSMSGSSNDTFFEHQTYNVYDLPAGYQFCIGISLWPAQSADGGKDMSASGNGLTYYSSPTCMDVHKKSSFQIWGGSLITNGSLNVPVSVKNNLYNYYGYTLNGSNATIYGSWVEYAAIAGGNSSISGLSSGASGGYTTNNNGTPTANPGGTSDTKSNNYCKRTPLSLANTTCVSNTPSAGVGISTAILRSIKDNVISTNEAVTYRASGTNANLASDYNLSKDGQTRRTYFNKGASVSISSSTALPATTTHVIYAENGTVNINSDLKYVDTKYTSINQVPQYIIYAKDINIACSVKVVNAWLLADGGKINTCYDVDNDDAKARSNQLRVNGPVVANNIKMGRTYGTAYGKYTEEAGEIFNYTPMTYMWSETGATNTPTLYNTYTREISPRY